MRKYFSYLAVMIAGLLVIGLQSQPTEAGDIVVSNTSTDSSSTWFIDGEPTLVMNGFDLTPLALQPPVIIDAVRIAIAQAIPEAPVELVIYQDGNGGSPADAQLIRRQTVTIAETGTVRIPLNEPISTAAPVIWVGFYLPVDFRFLADTSGSSVLTYWGWTPGSTFDLSNLSTAAVFGPSDGSAPVNLDLGGVARISIELTASTGETSDASTVEEAVVGQQIVGQAQPDLSILQRYPYCGESVFFDPQDIAITAEGSFTLSCRADLGPFSPGVIRNIEDTPGSIPSYERRGILYEIFAGGDYQKDPRDSEKLRVPVTHCIRPEQADLEQAVIGIAWGAPRQWKLLPSVRYGEIVCAEVTHAGFFSYFVPRSGDEPTLNADLYFSGGIEFITDGQQTPEILCSFPYRLNFAIRNEGFEPTPATTVRIQDVHVRTGTIAFSLSVNINNVPPGETVEYALPYFIAPSIFINEAHRIILTIDPGNGIAEMNEENNTRIFEYILLPSNKC